MNLCSISSMIQRWIHFLTNPFCHLKNKTGIHRPNWNFTSSWYQTWSIWFWDWNRFLILNTTPDSNWTGWILLSNVKCDLIFRIQTAPLLSVRFIFMSGLNVMQQRNVLLLSSHRLLVIIKIQYNDTNVVRFKWLWAGIFVSQKYMGWQTIDSYDADGYF